jgi:hypothetical protein
MVWKTIQTIGLILILLPSDQIAQGTCSQADLIRGMTLARKILAANTTINLQLSNVDFADREGRNSGTPSVPILVPLTDYDWCQPPIEEWIDGLYQKGGDWWIEKINDDCNNYRCTRMFGLLGKQVRLSKGVWCKDGLGNYIVPFTTLRRDKDIGRNLPTRQKKQEIEIILSDRDEFDQICRRCGIF